LFGAVTLVTSQTYNYYASVAVNPNFTGSRETLQTNQLISARLNQIAFGAFGVVAITGIIQAQIAFVPEIVTIRKRAVPPRPTTTSIRMLPTVGLSKEMIGIGLMGTF
jgi:hypothetical protein